MCFSATASFTAGAALSAVGGLTVHKSRGKIELPLAVVPLLFGIQQLTEGVLWISLTRDLPALKTVATDAGMPDHPSPLERTSRALTGSPEPLRP